MEKNFNNISCHFNYKFCKRNIILFIIRTVSIALQFHLIIGGKSTGSLYLNKNLPHLTAEIWTERTKVNMVAQACKKKIVDMVKKLIVLGKYDSQITIFFHRIIKFFCQIIMR